MVIALHEDMPESHVHALACQNLDPSAYEVLIVDGWHAPGAVERVEWAIHEAAREAAIRVLRIPRAGRAKAWNVGIAATTAPVVLLLADDCRAVPELLDRHLALHRKRPEPHVAALGPAVFPPELRGSPFRRWLDDSGRLFGVSFTRAEPAAITGFFFGANSSVKRAFLERVGPFDEAFHHHGWDDFEMGQRLFEAGMEIEYLPDAVTYHEHPITLAERRAIMREAGESAAVFARTRPVPEPWHSVTSRSHSFLWLRMQKRQAAFLARGDRSSMERYFQARLELDFARGYSRAVAGSHGGGRLLREGPPPSGH